MLKTLVNEAHLVLNIVTTGPLLIKSGYNTISGPDMAPVLTYRNGQPEVFLPGSSLKGVFRSHLEKVVGSIKPLVACDPFLQDTGNEPRNNRGSASERLRDALTTHRPSCGAYFDKVSKYERIKELPTDRVYRESCPTCRLFGSTSFAGRVAISDAYLADDSTEAREVRKKVERRDGVGIDRLTGGASDKAKFDLEVVTTGVTFATTVHLRNFETWQLGMLFIVIQDMKDELIRIGSGRSRGLGKITATISEQERDGQAGGITTSIIRGNQEPEKELWGMGRWLDYNRAFGDGKDYGTQQDDLLTLSQSVTHTPRGIRNVRTFKGELLDELKEKSIEQFVIRMQQWPATPEAATNMQRRG